MLNAIGPSPQFRTATASPAGLENQLARYRQQLSDCCAATSKTPQGQETARELSDRISQIKSRLEEVATDEGQASASPGGANSGAQPLPMTATIQASGALGNHLNIYA